MTDAAREASLALQIRLYRFIAENRDRASAAAHIEDAIRTLHELEAAALADRENYLNNLEEIDARWSARAFHITTHLTD